MNGSFRPRWLLSLMLFLTCSALFMASQQQHKTKAAKSSPQTESQSIDPLALQVLKAATDRIQQAKSYSFHTMASREQLGTNDQVITQFSVSEYTVERPDKLRVNFKGKAHQVELIYNAGQATLFAPEEKLYKSFQAATTIDATLANLEKRDIFLPSSNFLQSDPYASLTRGLTSAYVIGRTELAGETVHQLAFTEPHAEWQLWVTGGDNPTIRRLQVINKELAYHPRITVDFSDWNFNASPDTAMFTFQKPAGATEIKELKIAHK